MPDDRAPEEVAALMDAIVAGALVGHTHPELADWRGRVTPDGNGRYWDGERMNARVAWHAGEIEEVDPPVTGWYDVYALRPLAEDPDLDPPLPPPDTGAGAQETAGA